MPIFAELFEQTGWTKADIGFWCSGSSDYLAGRSFSFVSAVDAIGALPPVNESHVEMDAAWALYEAWVKIQTGEVDTALVYGFGKSSAGVLRRTLAMQLDPYTMTPLWPDTVSIAGLQARQGIEHGLWDEKALAEVRRGRASATDNENAIRKGATRRGRTSPRRCTPTRCAAPTARRSPTGPRRSCSRPPTAPVRQARADAAAWITGFEHRIDQLHARHPRPDPLPQRPRSPARRPARPASTPPSCTRPSPTRS